MPPVAEGVRAAGHDACIVDAEVLLTYYPTTPAHVVARLGLLGWHERCGWTAEEACDELAATLIRAEPPPDGIAPELLRDQRRLAAALEAQAGLPLLAAAGP